MVDLSRVVAAQLRQRRQAIGWTQADLAEKAGVSTELVSRIERARCLPSVPTLVAFARALKTTPDGLLGVQEAVPGRELGQLVELLRALPTRRLHEIRGIAEAFAQYKKVE